MRGWAKAPQDWGEVEAHDWLCASAAGAFIPGIKLHGVIYLRCFVQLDAGLFEASWPDCDGMFMWEVNLGMCKAIIGFGDVILAGDHLIFIHWGKLWIISSLSHWRDVPFTWNVRHWGHSDREDLISLWFRYPSITDGAKKSTALQIKTHFNIGISENSIFQLPPILVVFHTPLVTGISQHVSYPSHWQA